MPLTFSPASGLQPIRQFCPREPTEPEKKHFLRSNGFVSCCHLDDVLSTTHRLPLADQTALSRERHQTLFNPLPSEVPPQRSVPPPDKETTGPARRRKRAVSSEPEDSPGATTAETSGAANQGFQDSDAQRTHRPINAKRRFLHPQQPNQDQSEDLPALVAAPPVPVRPPKHKQTVIVADKKGNLASHSRQANRLVAVNPAPTGSKQPRYRRPVLTQYHADQLAKWDFSDLSAPGDARASEDPDTVMDGLGDDDPLSGGEEPPSIPMEERPVIPPPPLQAFLPEDLEDLEDFEDDGADISG